MSVNEAMVITHNIAKVVMTPIIELSALNSKLFSTITLQKFMSKLKAFHCFQQGQTICGWISGPAL